MASARSASRRPATSRPVSGRASGSTASWATARWGDASSGPSLTRPRPPSPATSRPCATTSRPTASSRSSCPASPNGDPRWLRFSRLGSPEVFCCVGSMNRIIPNYVIHMWMATADRGLAATLYGPAQGHGPGRRPHPRETALPHGVSLRGDDPGGRRAGTRRLVSAVFPHSGLVRQAADHPERLAATVRRRIARASCASSGLGPRATSSN